MNVELTFEERRLIAFSLKQPIFAKRSGAEAVHSILNKIGFSTQVLCLRADPPWVERTGWIVSVVGGEPVHTGEELEGEPR